MFRSGFAGGLASVTQEQVAPLLESLYYFEGWKNRLTEVVPLYRQDQLCGLAVFEAYTEPVQMKLHPTGAPVPFVKMFPLVDTAHLIKGCTGQPICPQPIFLLQGFSQWSDGCKLEQTSC